FFAPSIREIGSAFGIKSTNGVSAHLDALEKKGVLKKEWKIARAISLKEDGGFQALPVFGNNPQGIGFFSEENVIGKLVVDSVFLRGKGEFFSMRARDDRDGYMVFKKQRFAIRGDTVAALLCDSVSIGDYDEIAAEKTASFEILGVAVAEFKPISQSISFSDKRYSAD
ncbi:MAG: hypothetical protein FJ088_09480, partial [Deltaproteobacteria bacterium]|nr:hypothetical protein [Deltaproteobacteria bacterium]